MSKRRKSTTSLCPCGSGKSQEVCCRTQKPPVAWGQIANEVHKNFKGKKNCFHPHAPNACRGKIVDAHTVQKKGALSKILDSGGHLLSFYPPSVDEDGEHTFRKLGINNASTFLGFCELHDSAIFYPLEQMPFIGSEEQCFLLAYRALCFELYSKMSSLLPVPSMEKIKGLSPQHRSIIENMVSSHRLGTEIALGNFEKLKNRFDLALLEKKFEMLRSCIIRFEGDISVVSTGGCDPDFDIKGRRIRSFLKIPNQNECLFYGIVGTENGGAAIFSWPSECVQISEFIDSILNDSISIPSSVVSFNFAYLENTYFSSAWFNSLNPTQRNFIRKLATTPVQYGTPVLYNQVLGLVNWKNLKISKTPLS